MTDPEIPEAVKDLLWDTKPSSYNAMPDATHNRQILEAFERGHSDYARLERERERLRNALREARSALADYSRRSMWGYESDSDVSRAREAIDAALAPAQEPKA